MFNSLWLVVSKRWVLPGIFGAFAFLVIAGPAPLDVTNVAWLGQKHDTAMNQLGWTFYRHAPWSAPIALNPNYGMEFGASILFSDAIPLLALPLKWLSPILPEPFQYFGWWAFASFVLQGVFGWTLMSRATERPAARILGACLLSLAPAYCMRLAEPAATHMTLTAHWMILAGLTLCLTPRPRRSGLWWGLLLLAAALVHPYLLAMCATLWCADFIRRAWRDGWTLWFEPIAIVGSLAALMAATGVFTRPPGGIAGPGFGWFKTNILAFIDSNGWSYVLPDIPSFGWRGDLEGFAFLGLGGLVLVAVAAWSLPAVLRAHPPDLKYAPLAVALVGMSLFALSWNVTLGPWHIFVPWPWPLQTLGEIFRSTGRFVWPLYYFLFFAAVFVISRRLSPAAFTAVLALAVLTQAVDCIPGWARYRTFLSRSGTHFETALTSPFWSQAGKRYNAVRVAPHPGAATPPHPRFAEIASFADAYRLPTDAAYLTRTSPTVSRAVEARTERAIATGIWPGDTLFVLDEDVARRANRTLDRKRDFLARVDGLIVLAPAWRGCSDCGAIEEKSPRLVVLRRMSRMTHRYKG
jgi:Family of unknown function (DUF6311)